MIVVSDTSPINYLALIGAEDLLGALFGEVVIPSSVFAELSDAGAPPEVRRLLNRRPDWMRIVTPGAGHRPGLDLLDQGERDAILIAIELKAGLVLIDELRGRKAAEMLGLAVTGTVGLIERAVREGLADGAGIAARLRKTSFRVAPSLLARIEEAAAGREKDPGTPD
jgi:predicted nucleic acid-binding protein